MTKVSITKIHCGVGPTAFICAEYKWRTLDNKTADILQETVQNLHEDKAEPGHTQITIDIEITLQKNIPTKEHGRTLPGINETNLTPAAFQPKVYNLQMAKGKIPPSKWLCFTSPGSSQDEESADGGAEFFEASYDLRIVFDKSPFPPLEEWVEQKNGVDRAIRLYKFWEFRDFYNDA